MRRRYYCPTCKRPIEAPDSECLHGLGPAPEPWDGGLSATPEDMVREYGITLEEAHEILDAVRRD